MLRRHFIATTLAAAAATALPALATPAPYWCDCNRVRYTWRKVGHYAASHIFIDGKWQRMNYGLFLRHNHIHRKLRS